MDPDPDPFLYQHSMDSCTGCQHSWATAGCTGNWQMCSAIKQKEIRGGHKLCDLTLFLCLRKHKTWLQMWSQSMRDWETSLRGFGVCIVSQSIIIHMSSNNSGNQPSTLLNYQINVLQSQFQKIWCEIPPYLHGDWLLNFVLIPSQLDPLLFSPEDITSAVSRDFPVFIQLP